MPWSYGTGETNINMGGRMKQENGRKPGRKAGKKPSKKPVRKPDKQLMAVPRKPEKPKELLHPGLALMIGDAARITLLFQSMAPKD